MAPYRRGNSFYVRIYERGKRTYVGSWKIRDYGEEEAYTKALEAEIEARRNLVEGRETLAHLIDRYRCDYNRTTRGGEGRWSERTLALIGNALRPFGAAFGHRLLRELNTAELRPWAASQPTRYVAIAKTMLNDALADGLVARNPFTGIKLSEGSGRKGIRVLSEAELESLIDFAHAGGPYGPTMAAMIALAGYTGIRQGEMFALEPSDIQGDTLHIRQSWTGKELKLPKTNRTRRIYLPPQAARRLATMPRRIGHRWLFESMHSHQGGRYGAILKASTLYGYWDSIRKAFEATLPPARAAELRVSRGGRSLAWHELRHTAATILVQRGLGSKLVADQLGHATTRQVDTLYSHPADDWKLEQIRAAFGGAWPPKVADPSAANGSPARKGRARTERRPAKPVLGAARFTVRRSQQGADERDRHRDFDREDRFEESERELERG